MRVCLTERMNEPWLIPGCRVKPLKSPHEKTCIVGSIFEELTAVVLNGSRLQIDSTYDCCPDVCKPFTLIESKASCRTCFVIHKQQMDAYRNVWADHITTVWFALWRYQKVDGLPPTDVFTERVIDGVQDLWLVDFALVDRLVQLAPVMYYIRTGDGRIGYYRVDIRALAGLFKDPAGFAGPGFEVRDLTMKARVTLDGVDHITPSFRMVSVLDPLPF